MNSLYHENQADVIISRPFISLPGISMTFYFQGMVNQIYPPELQSNKAITKEAPFKVYIDLSIIASGFVSSEINEKRDFFYFDFDVVNFPVLHGGVPRRASSQWAHDVIMTSYQHRRRSDVIMTSCVCWVMIYTLCNLFSLLESAIVLRTSTREINI